MSPESEEHSKIKEIVLENLRSKYGSGLKEYPDSGSINDVKVVTGDGISIFIENVWTSKKTNFDRDLNILLRSRDNVKILVVNPDILREGSLVREFQKTLMTEREKGFQVSPMIDGSKILNDPDYVQNEFGKIVAELVAEARKRSDDKPAAQNNQSRLKHSRLILLTRKDYQGLDNWARVNLMDNLILHGKDQPETLCLMQHFETGYREELWDPLMEYKILSQKYDNPIVPFPPRFQEEIGGYGRSLEYAFERIPETDKKRLLELKEKFLENIDKIIFGVKSGKPWKGGCDYC
jgi:hypothetical protein